MTFPIKIISTGGYPRSITSAEIEYLHFVISTIEDTSSPIPVFGEDDSTAIQWVERKDLESQVDSLVVIGICQCGDPDCHTVQFQHYSPGQSLEIIKTDLEDGRTISISINQKSGQISGLQIVKE